ncbi:MAG: AmmeMemoRadiSam system radical SAM enzyme [Candidatus Izemoplasmatales bacterium]|nr:AmmeMemoRadiSam system radical SAM enzyme [Candidatus Izemoplasmatales bacterium]MDD4354972.1 AmmeMemoRadiSam system radical SAM enzyme [Candidatus Izemoplasmatales bacterium]
MEEAMLYSRLEDDFIQCHVCPHRCVIKPGGYGVCHTRMNQLDKLMVLNDGLAVAVAIDPIEKKPLYHFLPGSRIYSLAAAGCNLQCPWCQNWEISQVEAGIRPFPGKNISPEDHVKWALAYHVPAIAYTYTEPTVYLEYAFKTMVLAKEKQLKNVWVTNGYMTKETLELILPYLDAANVDLKAPDDQTYERLCKGSAKPVMDCLKLLVKNHVHVEITTLIVPGVNDQAIQIEAMATFIETELGNTIPWHLNRFHPAWKMKDTQPTPIETLIMARSIAKKHQLKQIHLGNV